MDIKKEFQSPYNPCDEPYCRYSVHLFPHHPDNQHEVSINATLRPDTKEGQLLPKTASIMGLSHWCMRHTIDHGYCWRCASMDIIDKRIGICQPCKEQMWSEIKAADLYGMLYPQDLTDQFLASMPLARVIVRDNDDTPLHKRFLNRTISIPKKKS